MNMYEWDGSCSSGLIGEIDQQRRETAFGVDIILENLCKRCVSERFRKTLTQCFSSSRII